MIESGHFDRLWKKYGKEFKTNCKSVFDNQVPLTMRDVFMPFVTLSCALATSFIILYLEKFVRPDKYTKPNIK